METKLEAPPAELVRPTRQVPIRIREKATLPGPPVPTRPEQIPQPVIAKAGHAPARAPEIRPSIFSAASASPTTKAPAAKVQTGGFGDENGIHVSAKPQPAKLNVPVIGTFDLPSGSGNGNGGAGKNGRPGVIASAGFGDGQGGGQNHAPGGDVQNAGFGELNAAPAVRNAAAAAPPARTAVEILEKPTPAYTEEARELKVEGEVHLKVLFKADGTLEVLAVLHGLGHGLDESAMRAAQRIRFKPAHCGADTCNSTLTVRMIFQLAG